jgi:ribosomal protein L37AE/L43A
MSPRRLDFNDLTIEYSVLWVEHECSECNFTSVEVDQCQKCNVKMRTTGYAVTPDGERVKLNKKELTGVND